MLAKQDEVIENFKSAKIFDKSSVQDIVDYDADYPILKDENKRNLFEAAIKLRNENKPLEALKRFNILLDQKPTDDQKTALFTLIGNTCLLIGDYDEAISKHKKALKVAEQTNNLLAKGVALGNIGLIYHDKGEQEKAPQYYHEDLEIFRDIGYKLGEATALGSIGLVYHDKGEPEKALQYYQESLAINREIEYKLGEASQLGNIGVIYADKGESEKAIQYLEQAQTILNN